MCREDIGIGGRNSKHIIDNLKININLLEACYINKVEKVIFISSSTVYQQANYPICEDELDLNKPPYDCYRDVGWLNRYVEQLCKYYFKDHGMKIGIVRPTNLYGPYDKFDDERSHILPALIKRALRKENPFVVWGDGEVIRDFVYVDDFIDDLFGIFEKKCDCDPINIGSNKATTVKAAANIILNLCGHDSVTPQFDLSKPTAIPYRMLNVDKLAMTFGNRKRTSLEEGLSKTIRWYEHLPNS
ncbi:MAG: hypothetical protein A3G92_07580 [Deltaproteobacteria bacterium RIFCSPLOWO2_12_FULL_38_8]|nr:MAG: hypothetical protein A3G92_07580 [Deltaproteobacteria bacterium RIFCSPLOWO2_12_FULL_38_8]